VTDLFFRGFYGIQIVLESLNLTGLARNYGNQDLKGEIPWRCPPRREDLRMSYISDNLNSAYSQIVNVLSGLFLQCAK